MNRKPNYDSVDQYPATYSGSSVVVRLLDGLGYRFQYATEALTMENYAFRPCEGALSIEETVQHIWWLVNWVSKHVMGKEDPAPETATEYRQKTLDLICGLQSHFENLDDSQLETNTIGKFPFWHIINGPLADALTHVGQINTIRRLAGNPTVKHDVFRMTKPEA